MSEEKTKLQRLKDMGVLGAIKDSEMTSENINKSHVCKLSSVITKEGDILVSGKKGKPMLRGKNE